MPNYPPDPIYSDRYYDESYEYRHVTVTRQMTRDAQAIMTRRPEGLLSEQDWRGLGVQQSRGWTHYMVHKPEPQILLFRRPLGTDPTTGRPVPGWRAPADDRALAPEHIRAEMV
eukprot:GHVU01091980.1.p1 GENE.GHVU01091980.1~~GHVU01091980.1.p1  ORF type:complete len:114 (+),score=1.31 GHVU01091980.1:80-421(+)